MERAKEIFLEYGGNRFFMDHNGDGQEYELYHVPKETEEMWAAEYIARFLDAKPKGKEAVRAYSTVTELLKGDRRDATWEKCLYYPLRSEDLDDVAILHLLPCSFKMVEKAVKKKMFSRKDADAYIAELDRFSRRVLERANRGTVTRAAEYAPQEFADSVYVAGYLEKIRKKWDSATR